MGIRIRDIAVFPMLIVALFVMAACPARSFAKGPQNVRNTPHNLGTTGGGALTSTDENEICVFCHTPHSSTEGLPLWNHYSTATNKPFLIYTSSATLDATFPTSLPLDSISRNCLACHEGTTAFNTLVRPGGMLGHLPGWVPTETSFEIAALFGAPYEKGTPPYFGTDLRNSHPIGFNYDIASGADNKLVPRATAEANGVQFFGKEGNMLECSSCHDPHVDYNKWAENTPGAEIYTPFLRVANQTSRLCMSCHQK